MASASETLQLVAAEDVCDASGVRLVAEGQPINADTQTRLARRRLHKPLETSLRATAGVRLIDIEQTALKLCQSSAFLVVVVGRDFATLRHAMRSLHLPPFAHLLLSVQQATQPSQFNHSVLCGMVAGALAIKQGGPPANAQLAMAAGLVHDVGEMYRDTHALPHIAGAYRDRWREVVEHPTTGMELIAQFTDYPDSVARAVHEHHERLDGSGYPRGTAGEDISPLGRVLGLADAICGVIKSPDNQGARVKLAVSCVPGEFDPHLVSKLTASVSGTLAAEIALPAGHDPVKTLGRAKKTIHCLDEAHRRIEELAQAPLEDPKMAAIVSTAQHRIARLKTSLEATGIGDYFVETARREAGLLDDAEAYFDLDVVSNEQAWRMRSLSRNLVLRLQQSRLSGYGALESVIAALEVER
jgi:putative nucleotidyltransferase with HDIG domain